MKGQPDLGMVLAFNNDPQHRTPLSVGQSFDGKTWTRLLDIENDPSGSFEYPTMIQSQVEVILRIYFEDTHASSDQPAQSSCLLYPYCKQQARDGLCYPGLVTCNT